MNTLNLEKYLLLFIFSCIYLHPFSALALIESGGLHFMKSPSIRIKRQDINLSLDKIKVSYVFQNTSAIEKIETLVFPMPSNLKQKNDKYIKEKLNQVAIYVNNQPIELRLLEIPISYSSRDISRILTSFGLPMNPIAAMHQIDQSPNMDSIRRNLIKLDLLDPNHDTPKWFNKSFYYFQQLFPAHLDIQIKQSYKPTVNILKNPSNYTTFFKNKQNMVKKWYNKINFLKNKPAKIDNYDSYIKGFCPSPSAYKQLAIALKNKKLITREINFNLMQNNNWEGPIEHFTIKIHHPNNMQPMLCWESPFTRNSPNSVLFEAKNYVPLQNISLLLVELLEK